MNTNEKLCPYSYKPERRWRRRMVFFSMLFVGFFLIAVAFCGANWEAVYKNPETSVPPSSSPGIVSQTK